jgi:predicted nucleic acid-binding protein
MIFADLRHGDSVFIDANVLVYHFEPHAVFGPACTTLIRRIELGELLGFTSTHVQSEVAHRLMTLEACTRFGWPYSGIAQRLRSHPAEVQKLKLFRQAIQQIPRYHVQVLTVAPHQVAAATAISQQTGLLTNDALVVAVMREHGLVNLASHDADFDRAAGLARYGPG